MSCVKVYFAAAWRDALVGMISAFNHKARILPRVDSHLTNKSGHVRQRLLSEEFSFKMLSISFTGFVTRADLGFWLGGAHVRRDMH